MTIAIIGAGRVGAALGARLARAGEAVRFGVRDAALGRTFEAQVGHGTRAMTVAEAAGFRPHDAGPLRNATLLENLAVLWIHLASQGGKGRQFSFRLEGRR